MTAYTGASPVLGCLHAIARAAHEVSVWRIRVGSYRVSGPPRRFGGASGAEGGGPAFVPSAAPRPARLERGTARVRVGRHGGHGQCFDPCRGPAAASAW